MDLVFLAQCVSSRGLCNAAMNRYFAHNSVNFLINCRNGDLFAGLSPQIE